jgi:hypothetical protein
MWCDILKMNCAAFINPTLAREVHAFVANQTLKVKNISSFLSQDATVVCSCAAQAFDDGLQRNVGEVVVSCW